MKTIKKIIKTIFYPLYVVYKKQQYNYAKNNPKIWADKVHKRNFGYTINWENPRDLNEKIRWLQFNSDTTLWSILADKYRVREYIESKGYGNILVKLYGKWDKADDIDFDQLPQSFVLKTNHGCGEIILVKDKTKIDITAIKKKIQKYLDTPFGVENAEPHYLKIKPCIIAEELLTPDTNFSSSLIDYKFYCFNGKPVACGVFYDRDIELHRNNITPYDMNWNKHPEWRRNNTNTTIREIPRPITLEQMIKACNELASEFPFVRMDFYEVNGKLYFGEFTFTPGALGKGAISEEKIKEWGQLIKIKNE